MTTRMHAFALLLLAGTSATAAHAEETGEALMRSAITRIDASPQWRASAGRIGSEGSSTVVEAVKIAREDNSGSLDVASLRFDRLVPNGTGGFAFTALAVTGLKSTIETISFSVPEIKAGAFKTAGTTGWSFDAGSPATSIATLYTQLAASEFDEIVLPLVTFQAKLPGIDVKAASTGTYSNIRVGPLKGGILAAQSVERVETAGVAPDQKPIRSILENLEARNIDLGAFARVIDPAAYGAIPDRQWKRMQESASYAKVTIRTGEAAEASFGPVTARDFYVRQTSVPLAPAIDALVAQGKPGDEEWLSFAERYGSDITGWFRFGSFAVENLAVKPPEGGSIALAKLALEDLSADGLKRFALEGFAANTPAFTAGLKSFEIGDVEWPSLSLYLAFARLDEAKENNQTPDPALVARIAGDIFNVIPYIGRLSLSGLSAGLPGGEPFTLESYSLSNQGGTALLPKIAEVKLLSAAVPRAILHATPQTAQIFGMLGYDRLVIDAESRSDYDDAAGRYANSFRVGVRDAGILALEYALAGLTPTSIRSMITPFIAAGGGEPNPALLLAAFGPLSIEGVTLRFEDNSLTRRVLPVLAQMQNVDELTLIANATAMLQLGLAQLGNQSFTEQAVKAAGDFLKSPESFTVRLRPPAPITVGRLLTIDPNNPGAAIDLLGLGVSAND